MIIDRKSSKFGVPIILVGLLLFVGLYAYLLTEPIQAAYIAAHKRPAFFPFFLWAIADGLLLGTFLHVGYSLSTLAETDFVSDTRKALPAMIRSKNFLITVGLCIVAALVCTMMWRGDI